MGALAVKLRKRAPHRVGSIDIALTRDFEQFSIPSMTRHQIVMRAVFNDRLQTWNVVSGNDLRLNCLKLTPSSTTAILSAWRTDIKMGA